MPACVRCGEENPEEARFCAACGAYLTGGCPACGAELPPGARFCPACGATTTAAEAASPTRKLVTVFFCDIANSTPLGEQLDVETFRSVMSSYYTEMRTVLERHGGTVEKFIGDAVMAVFGIPMLHDDDALRAVRAAIDMREAIASLNEELRRTSNVELTIRAGIASGEVVAGDPSGGQAFATGEAVVVAERLEGSCRPGEILLDDTTHRLSRNAILVEALDEPLVLKGKSEAVRAWRLIGVLTGALPFARRLDSKLVGREPELALLERAFRRAAEERNCHLFTLLGVAGVGKSRLVGELSTLVADRATVLVGRCLPYGEGITFWPLMEVVKQAAGITLDLSSDQAQKKIADLLADEPDAAVVAQRIAATIGLSEGRATTDESFWAARKLLEALSHRRPLLVVFDDLHWAAPTFLDLVEHLADWCSDAPVLLLCAARPELLDERPAWAGGKLNATSILLEALSETECAHLIENLLGGDLSEDAGRRIAGATEGNPLFIEELLAMLIDDEVLERKGNAWLVRRDLSTITVPPTIQALLAARLDRLSPPERAVMAHGSVVGKLFHRRALAALAPEGTETQLAQGLAALVRKELIRPARSSFADDEAFRFRHILIRDAAYNAIPKQTRADLHERCADWLEDAARDRIREFEEIAGYHLEQAHRYCTELAGYDKRAHALAARAAERLASVGRRAFSRGDMPAAVGLLTRATILLREDDPTRLQLAPDLGRALTATGELAQAEVVLSRAIDAAAAAGDSGLESFALIERALLRLIADPEGTAEEAQATAEQALGVFEALGDELGLARAWVLIGVIHWMRCHLAEMEDVLERALEHARRARDQREIANILNALARAALLGPSPIKEAIPRCEQILDEAAGDQTLEGVVAAILGSLHAMLGRFEGARVLYARSRTIFENLGLPGFLAALPMYSFRAEMLAGNPALAELELRAAFDALERMGETGYLSTVAAFLARALSAQEKYDAAARFTEVSEQAASRDDVVSQVVWRQARAQVLAAHADFAEAERLAREAVTLAARTDFLTLHGDALVDLAGVLRGAGDTRGAAAAVEHALALYEEKGDIVSSEATRALLAEVVAVPQPRS